ncbi:unnamed protein product [Aureobasidium uvarum]|uniref:Gfd2/YDR514C-like C-terminal domain-containing protein n=1 Tax=Aureobasidium uvarum TaxID=2773716 RepID=A0A9N8KH80_9PEZI|nr:unnamed protein product [Aureobasidium uvarum]
MGTVRRNLSFLEATRPNLQPSTIESAPIESPKDTISKAIVAEQAPPSIEVVAAEPEEDTMNSQKEAELLTMQHIFGLKDASDDSLKTKPKELERLQRLKAAEPVFVCVDLEAYEFSQEKITEVGVSVLDSRHVIGSDPGPDGMEWLSKINTRHIIIQEHKRLVNKRFVHGCPDKFNFGNSEVVPLKHIHKALTQLFDNPSPDSIRASDQGSRNLILVGHGLSNDTAYLNKLGFAPHAKGNIIQDVDTQKFVGSKKQTVGLSRLMAGLGVQPENLHNAGNDAAYTMQALLLMTVQHTNNPGAYVNAVANAKGKVDPAKQRYKDHKAAVRERKIAEEKAKAARAAAPQATSFGKFAVESASALYPKPHDLDAAATGGIRNAKSVEPQRRSQPRVAPGDGLRTGQDLGLPAPTASDPDRNVWLEAPFVKGLKARSDDAQKLLKGTGGNPPPFKRLPLVKDKQPLTHPSTSFIDQAGHVSVPSKRKSFDLEPVDDGWNDDDDDFSISPTFSAGSRSNQTRIPENDKKVGSMTDTHQHEAHADTTSAQPLTTGAASSVESKPRISKHMETRDVTNAPRFTEKEDSKSLSPPVSAQPNRTIMRKVAVSKTEMPRSSVKAAQPAEAAQQPDRPIVRRVTSKEAETQDIHTGQRRVRVLMAATERDSRETEEPQRITEENNPVLRKWLDGG